MRVDQFVDKLMYSLEDRSYKNRHYERTAFDPISKKMLIVLIENELYKRSNKFPIVWLSRLCSVAKRQIRTRVLHACRYGLIRVTSCYRNDKSGLNDSNIIEVNPMIIGIYNSNTPIKTFNSFCDHYFQVGYKRLDIDTGDVQGFWIDCLYGTKEPDAKEDALNVESWQTKLVDMIANEDEEKAAKQREAFLWMGLSNDFIDGSAKLWTKAQGALGYGYNKPVWAGDVATLGSTPKRERAELIKIFQTWGGFETAIAWFIFCCGVPQKDGKGRLEFDLTSPHRQFVSIDKKPSQFAKHFNAILSDDYYKDFTGKLIDEMKLKLEEYYGDVLKVKPRYDQFNTKV
jgi:hypothetical protein